MKKMSQSEVEKLDSYCKNLIFKNSIFDGLPLYCYYFLVHSLHDRESYVIVIGCEQANLSFAIFSVT